MSVLVEGGGNTNHHRSQEQKHQQVLFDLPRILKVESGEFMLSEGNLPTRSVA
jgi:hypothetical protein